MATTMRPDTDRLIEGRQSQTAIDPLLPADPLSERPARPGVPVAQSSATHGPALAVLGLQSKRPDLSLVAGLWAVNSLRAVSVPAQELAQLPTSCGAHVLVTSTHV